jgi:hypothetical protein
VARPILSDLQRLEAPVLSCWLVSQHLESRPIGKVVLDRMSVSVSISGIPKLADQAGQNIKR